MIRKIQQLQMSSLTLFVDHVRWGLLHIHNDL